MTATAKEFLAQIEVRKRDALLAGSAMELIIMNLNAAQRLSDSATKEDLSHYEFHVSEGGRVYIVGVPVMWSKGRVPTGQVWFRYGKKGWQW